MQPFRIFRLDPAATNEHNDDAGADVLIFQREAVLDPTRRLAYELSCPVDCPPLELEALYAALSNRAAPTAELLQFADRLWPLARANFVAHVIGRRPADAALLYALLESHASIDASAIYAKLKAMRMAAGIPAPSWVSVNEGLNEHLTAHSAAAFAGYDVIEAAVEPVLHCTQRILAGGDRHIVEALSSLLGSYRQFIDLRQKDANERVINACVALRAGSDDTSLIEELANAVQAWLSTTHPLLLWGAHQGHHELDFDTPIHELRALITYLSESKRYEAASAIADLSRELFSAVPTTFDQLVEDAHLIEDLSVHVSVRQLKDAIDELENDPGPLIAALEQSGFGQTSTEPARSLREMFLRATKAAIRQSAETPWQLIRDFAIRLSNRPEAAAAVTRLIADLILYGEKASAPPRLLHTLRDNLSFMKSFMGTEQVESENPGRDARSGPLTFHSLRRHRRIRWAALALLLLAACGFALYFEFDQVRPLWPVASLGSATQPVPSTLTGETVPPVGTGQHLALDGVRYCHFQEERLRIIKQGVQNPEDARALNLLIVDYNSRCSDFFYQDNDLKIVLAEVAAKKNLLEADAKQIMSTWPSRNARN